MPKFRKKPVETEAHLFGGPFSLDEMGEDWGAPFADVACWLDRPTLR